MLPLLQIFLLIITSVLCHICATNPNHSSTGDKTPYEGAGTTFLLFLLPRFGKLIIWISTLYQVLYLCLEIFSPISISTLFPQISTAIDPMPLTPISMAGYIFMIVGGLGRIWCFRTLGKFFTFEITIRNSHKLIKTGPYAYVRHPSYTFAYILAIGMCLVHQRFTNFFPNTRWIQIMFGSAPFFLFCIMLIWVFKRRVTREEAELKKTFGKEWTDYVSKTKRFIPCVI